MRFDDAYWKKWNAEQSDLKAKAIDNFIDRERLVYQTLIIDGHVLSIVGKPFGTTMEDLETCSQILIQQQKEAANGIRENCYYIAARAVDEGVAEGALNTPNDASKITAYGNHTINFLKLSDGTLLAFDLTTAQNIDHEQGRIAVLGIHGESLEEVKDMLGKLYGGQWNQFSEEEINTLIVNQYNRRR
ncbi:MAG: hypothetical protein EBQ80_02170 [Proteobacteria bacterium]|nr:hypothetical protein [Pseudomonadota bacterium]